MAQPLPIKTGIHRFPTEIIDSPRAAEIFAKVESVKLCPPPTQLETAASDVPTSLANSFCVIPLRCNEASILSAIA